MDDLGFNGTSSRFTGRFEAGSDLTAKKLNDVLAGIESALPRPYIGDGAAVSFAPGGSTITTIPQYIPPGPGPTYYPFEIVVYKDDQTEEVRLQIVKGTCLWGSKCLNQEAIVAVDDRSPCEIVDGGLANSPFMDNGGYCVIDAEQNWNVYLFNIKSQDDQEYLYEQVIFVCPDSYFTPACPVVLPTELTPTGQYEAQVIKIGEYEDPGPPNQMASGVLSFKDFLPTPQQFEIYVRDVDDGTGSIVSAMFVKPGTVIYTEGQCVTQKLVAEIDSRSPVSFISAGEYGNGIEVTEGIINFYLYLIKYIPTSGSPTYDCVLFAFPAGDYPAPACPVVLPEPLLPSTGTYKAQVINLGFCGGPYIPPNVNYAIGTLAFPGGGAEAADHPFKVKFEGTTDGESSYSVVVGAVNNAIPYNIEDTLTVTGTGYVWLQIPYDSTNKVFPKADEVIIVAGTAPPYSDGDYAYVWLAQVNGETVNQLITGSLWGDRIQLGSGAYASAQYYFAKV